MNAAGGPVESVAFSPASLGLIATGAWNKSIQIWDVKTGSLSRSLPETGPAGTIIKSVAFSPDGHILATASDEIPVNLWNPMNGELIRTLDGPAWSNTAAFSSDGRLLVTEHRMWKMPDGQPVSAPTGSAQTVAFSPDGKTFANGGANFTINLWDMSGLLASR